MLNCLKSEGISVLGISSDGDTRLLKSMRLHAKLQTRVDEKNIHIPYFCADCNSDNFVVIQDIIHVGAKFRTRFLKTSIVLPFGNYLASANHLQTIIDTISKDKHCLNLKDLSLKDKMNYASVEKISDKVIDLLIQEIPGSKGTVLYLKIINLFTDAL